MYMWCNVHWRDCQKRGSTLGCAEQHEHELQLSKHLFLNIGHSFNWSVLLSAPKNNRTRKILEAFFIAKMKSNLNEQFESNA